jgi:hypothetical protein
MGVHAAMTPTHARAPVGERAVCEVPGARGTNVSVIAAIRRSEMIDWYPHDGAVDTERCTEFIARITPKLHEGDVVVMDNVRFHHAADVTEAIRAAGARVLYIPPYHPEHDAIEEVFSVVKRDVRRSAPRTLCAIVDALRSAFGRLTGEMLDAFVQHALAFAIQPS